ncbi:MAG TPA: hypothetical protein VMF58_10020 [Rhizomicrobium sp.]|nr:hypothetical protein [Rhizomicrobium sp.]
MRIALVLLSATALSLAASIARADDQPFLTMDATDIEPEHAFELEQNFGWNTGMGHRAFSEFEGETEIEYGWSDKLQLAMSTSYAWAYEHDHTAPASPSESGSEWGGTEGEAVYRAMNVYFDPIGLGFLANGGVSPNSRGMEALLILQKNFINDRLRVVINTGGEFGSEKDGTWSDVSALTFNAGAAYNITWEWSAGIEFNVEHDFDGLLLNGKGVPVATSYYVGPNIQYIAHPWVATLGVQFQLPWANDPTHSGSVDRGYLAEAERARIGFRITRDLY